MKRYEIVKGSTMTPVKEAGTFKRWTAALEYCMAHQEKPVSLENILAPREIETAAQ